MTKSPQQKRHEQIVTALNQIYGEDKFTIEEKMIFPYNMEDDIDNYNKLLAAGVLVADVMNYTDGSTGQFDIYQLLVKYHMNREKRDAINKILRS